MQTDTSRQQNPGQHDCQDLYMTQAQRIKYSLLIALVVLLLMLGLSYLQTQGIITEKLFQYIAMGIAVLVVVINGVLRRKVKRP
jgi:hypothetical protein